MEHDTPHILLPPSMLEEERHRLENEAKSWLQIQTFKSAFDIQAGRILIQSFYRTLFCLLFSFTRR